MLIHDCFVFLLLVGLPMISHSSSGCSVVCLPDECYVGNFTTTFTNATDFCKRMQSDIANSCQLLTLVSLYQESSDHQCFFFNNTDDSTANCIFSTKSDPKSCDKARFVCKPQAENSRHSTTAYVSHSTKVEEAPHIILCNATTDKEQSFRHAGICSAIWENKTYEAKNCTGSNKYVCTSYNNGTCKEVCKIKIEDVVTNTNAPIDVDEATCNRTFRNKNAHCMFVLIGFRCKCKPGFTGNGLVCSEISGTNTGCIADNDCPERQKCKTINANGRKMCKPIFDMFVSNDSVRCTDVDECAAMPCHPKSTCTNTNGSFCCTCKDGYQGDGKLCLPTQAVLAQILKEANTTEAVEAVAEEIKVIANSNNLSHDAITQLVDFASNISKRAKDKKIKVTKNTMIAVVEITRGIKANGRNASAPGKEFSETSKYTERLVKAVTALALEVELDPEETSFHISAGSVQIKVKQYVGAQFPKLEFSPNTTNDATVKIVIPEAATRQAWENGDTNRTKRETRTRRSAFIYYSDDTLFYSEKNATSVVAADIGVPVMNLSKPVIIQHQDETLKYGKHPPSSNSLKVLRTTLKCMYWDFNLSDWSSDGCCLNSDNPPECHCNHLTNFAIIVDTGSAPKDVALSIVSTVGCVLSIIGLAVTVLVHAVHRGVRKRRPAKILMQICCNLLAAYLVFVTGVERTSNAGACMFVTVLLHYFMLTTWCWMAVYSYDMYMSVVKVFRNTKAAYLQRVAAFAYLVPAAIVTLNVGIAVGYFDQNQKNEQLCDGVADPLPVSTYRADNMCWLKEYSLYFGFLLPVGILLLYNCVVFATVLREISCKNPEVQTSAMKRTNKQTFLIAAAMTGIMGITWIFGYLMLFSTDVAYLHVMSWIFAILNTLQGFAIFLLTSIRSKDLRNVWWKPLRSAVSSTTSWARFSKSNDEFAVTTSLTQNSTMTTGTHATKGLGSQTINK